jgi:hypothetical protein
MLVKLAHLNTDENRKSYLINLTKDLRAKYGMDVERNKNFGRRAKKTGAKSSKQLALNFTKQSKFFNEKSRELAIARHEAIQAEGKTEVFQTGDGKLRAVEADRDYVTAEYIKKDDELRALQGKYDDLFDNVAELKREIVRLQVIVTYLEGKK